MAKKISRRGRRQRVRPDSLPISENGTHEYTGGRYVYQGTNLRSEKIQLGICAALMLISSITAGCFPAVGVNTPLVLIPYALTAAFSICTCWSLIRLCKSGNPMRISAYKNSVLRIPRRALITAVSAGAALAGQILYVIQNRYWKGLLLAPVFPVCMIITFLTAILLKQKTESMDWAEEKDIP